MSRVHVVAVVSPGSVGVPPAVVWQYAYEPYGRVVTAEALPPPGAPPGWAPPVNRVGFQGLFLEPVLFNASNAGLSTSSISLWCARNRFILSSIGRFLTRDPAEAAMPIITALAFNGDTLDAFLTGFSPTGHYADGFNLYQFVGSNPVNRRDPSGLIWGFAGEVLAMAWEADLRVSDAARVSAGYAALGTTLAAIFGELQWGVGGGMSAAGFDLFLEGNELLMAGEYALGEIALGAAEIGAFISSNAKAVKNALGLAANISAHCAKILGRPDPLNDPNFNGWKRDIMKALREIGKWLDSMNRATRPFWERYVEHAIRWLENPLGGPPPAAPG